MTITERAANGKESVSPANYEMTISVKCPHCDQPLELSIQYQEGEWHLVNIYGTSGAGQKGEGK